MIHREDLDEVDLEHLIFKATSQVPKGMVTTYGDIARALGDVSASRAVGATLSHNPMPMTVPCHRVVYGDGRVGWYNGHGKGTDIKAGLLTDEGVNVTDGMVKDLEKVRFKDFDIDPILRRLREMQTRCASLVVTDGPDETLDKLVGLDISYDGNDAYASCVILDVESGRTTIRTVKTKVRFPYIPGYLSFREMPAYLRLLDGVERALVLVDGQGRLHPRRFGIASHLGVRTGLRTVGVAKSLLSGQVSNEGDISLEGEVVGRVVLARGRRYYVSVGNNVSLGFASEQVQRFLSDPSTDVLAMAHRAATQARRASGE
ncbi:MAG: endonuclease V [Methanomassiliicoccales archaeon]|nr:MAG: endonuclease V [Methanomassiliicoccales archaeon]